ncbi:DNA methylase [Acidobacteria bacterium AH-259-O06]|nr:DNA methylase [Acidobacteria bacterium AH-259-O06]
MFHHLGITSPKLTSCDGRASWFPYYAGFSPAFAYKLLDSAPGGPGSTVLDPWNGSGTTSAVAKRLGYRVLGYDLNPVMVVVAKARMLSSREISSLWPITIELLSDEKTDNGRLGYEPLWDWFTPSSAAGIRAIEMRLQKLLVRSGQYSPLRSKDRVDSLSDLAAFFYTALFRTVRSLVRRFVASNPTWIKKPGSGRRRIRPRYETVRATFAKEVARMIRSMSEDLIFVHDFEPEQNEASISVASSELLPCTAGTVDLILSSPPYCTRIDYAVATMPELAVLGYGNDQGFRKLRESLIGTSTVPKIAPRVSDAWGSTCRSFLNSVVSHKSKSSHSYYYKNHVQYFKAIFRSIREISRVLKPGGMCVLVVQDSYYKEIHNDLAAVVIEMAQASRMELEARADFCQSRTRAGVNPSVRKYRRGWSATESVLCFRRV